MLVSDLVVEIEWVEWVVKAAIAVVVTVVKAAIAVVVTVVEAAIAVIFMVEEYVKAKNEAMLVAEAMNEAKTS